MARTTLMLDDGILRELKRRAAAEGRTVQSVANDLLRQALAGRGRPRERFVLRLEGWQGTEQPGVDILDRDKLFDLMDGR
jgi:plasmid stability protein